MSKLRETQEVWLGSSQHPLVFGDKDDAFLLSSVLWPISEKESGEGWSVDNGGCLIDLPASAIFSNSFRLKYAMRNVARFRGNVPWIPSLASEFYKKEANTFFKHTHFEDYLGFFFFQRYLFFRSFFKKKVFSFF